MNTDAHAELDAMAPAKASVERLDTRHDAEARVHRPPGVILVRLGIAEIDEQPVADVLGDVAVEAADCFGAGFLGGTQHLAQVFRIQLLGERRRADQVAEHHRQLATLGIGESGSGPLCRRYGWPGGWLICG